MLQKIADFSIIRIQSDGSDKSGQRVTGLSIPHTEFAPSPQCLIRLLMISRAMNRDSPSVECERKTGGKLEVYLHPYLLSAPWDRFET
jgi:hypothetical protein